MLLMKKKHRDYKSLLQGAQILLTLAVAIGVLFSSAPTTDGFIAFDHQNPRTTRKLNNLIRRVHKDQWVIGYAYADPEWGEPAGVCPPEARHNGAAIEETITKALQAWLQPVRDLNTGKPVVNDFRFVHKQKITVDEFKLYDLRIYFFCDFGISSALTRVDETRPPLDPHALRHGCGPTFCFLHLTRNRSLLRFIGYLSKRLDWGTRRTGEQGRLGTHYRTPTRFSYVWAKCPSSGPHPRQSGRRKRDRLAL